MAGLVGLLVSSSGWAQVSQSGNVYPFYDTPLSNPWRTFGPLVIGVSGTGSVGVAEGGSVIVSGSTTIGQLLGSSGTLSVGGEGASVSAGNLSVGNEGTGYMSIGAGGTVSGGPLGGSSVMGVAASGVGTVDVDGENAQWVAGPLTVGNFGNGFLTIRNQGKVSSSSNAYVGMYEGSESEVLVSGAGSEWVASGSGSFAIGSNGKGTLRIEGGGLVTSNKGTLGDVSGQGLVTVTGTDSLWRITNTLRVGNNSSKDNRLLIEAGGRVENDIGIIADYVNGSEGTVTVKGTGSVWENATTLSVGELGNGHLRVESGGQVSNTIGYIGNAQNGSRGDAVVTGAGSTWTSTGELYVGNQGRGSLRVSDGGRVVTDYVNMAVNVLAGGGIELEGTADHRGVLETRYIAEGGGSVGGTIAFDGGILRAKGDEANFLRNFETNDVLIDEGGAFIDTQAFAIGIATNLGGTGGLTKLGTGTLTLSGANTYTGATTVAAGTLVNNGSIAGDFIVKDGSTLKGTGTYAGAVTVEEGGTLAPGNSPGTIEFQNGLTLEENVILSLELGVVASDLIVVSGGDLLGPGSGTIFLQIVDAGDFAAGLYTLINAEGASLIDLSIGQFFINSSPTGYTYEVLRNGDLFQLQVDAVPEASTVVLLVVGAVVLVLMARRRTLEM